MKNFIRNIKETLIEIKHILAYPFSFDIKKFFLILALPIRELKNSIGMWKGYGKKTAFFFTSLFLFTTVYYIGNGLHFASLPKEIMDEIPFVFEGLTSTVFLTIIIYISNRLNILNIVINFSVTAFVMKHMTSLYITEGTSPDKANAIICLIALIVAILTISSKEEYYDRLSIDRDNNKYESFKNAEQELANAAWAAYYAQELDKQEQTGNYGNM